MVRELRYIQFNVLPNRTCAVLSACCSYVSLGSGPTDDMEVGSSRQLPLTCRPGVNLTPTPVSPVLSPPPF